MDNNSSGSGQTPLPHLAAHLPGWGQHTGNQVVPGHLVGGGGGVGLGAAGMMPGLGIGRGGAFVPTLNLQQGGTGLNPGGSLWLTLSASSMSRLLPKPVAVPAPASAGPAAAGGEVSGSELAPASAAGESSSVALPAQVKVEPKARMLRLVWQDPNEKGPSVAVTAFCGEMSYSHQELVSPETCKTWELLRKVAREKFKIPEQVQIRFEDEYRRDLEEAFPRYLTEAPPRAKPAADHIENVLVVTDAAQDFIYSFKPELSVTSIDVATDLDHITAIMELIENALEALLTGDANDTSLAKVDIAFDQLGGSITIRDNGCGMSKDDVHRAINMAQRKAQKTAAELADDDMLSGRFGRFGVGLKAAFVFGRSVLLRLDSKQANSGGRVTAELDYKQMQENNVYKCNISLPKSTNSNEGPGTKITISRIDGVFWKEFGEVDQLGKWHLKPEARKRLAEKYCLYMHGVLPLQRALHATKRSGLAMAREGNGQRRPVCISVEGKNLAMDEVNDVFTRMNTLCGHRAVAGSQAMGGSAQASDPMVFPNPLWHKTLSCKGEPVIGHTPGRRVNNRTVAELVLFFLPKVGEEPAEEDTMAGATPRIMVFWQGLYFAEERLDGQVLPWMKKARESFNKRTQTEVADAFDRVVGFLFLDGTFRPDSHKTRLHMQDEMVKELMEVPVEKSQRGRQERVLTPTATTLLADFKAQVQRWHDEHDRLNTFKGLLKQFSGTRNGEPYFRWERVCKVFPPGSAPGSASRGPELEFRSASDERIGDPVKVNVRGQGRLQILRGFVKFVETSTEAPPHSGGRIWVHRLHRPTNALDGPYAMEQIMYEARKETEGKLKQEDQAARMSYPASLALSRRTLSDKNQTTDAPLGREILKLARDELEQFSLVVDVLDGAQKRMPFETESTKVKLSDIYLKVTVLRDHHNPAMRQEVPFDENSPHVLIRYNVSSRAEGGRYVLEAALFDGWKVFDRAGNYVMVVSLYYDMQDVNRAVQECGLCCSKVLREIKLEILSGTPKLVTFETAHSNVWFGQTTGTFKMIFQEGSGVPMAPQLLTIEGVWWCIPGKTAEQQLRVTFAQGNFVVEALCIDEGWNLGGSEQTAALQFRVRFRMTGQQRELSLTCSNRIVIKGGAPAVLQLDNEAMMTRLEPNKLVVSNIDVLDKWGNSVRGSNQRPLKLVTKSKCLDRNKPRTLDFQVAPVKMELGTVTASFGDGGKLTVQCNLLGVAPIEVSYDLQVLSMQLCFAYLSKGQSEPSPEAVGADLEYSSSDMPKSIMLKIIDPKTGKVEPVDRQLSIKRSASGETFVVKLAKGVSANLVPHLCPTPQNAPGNYVAVSEDGMLQASLNLKLLPSAPANLLIRNSANLALKIGQKFDLAFDVVDSKNIAYSDAGNLRILLQCSDGSVEFDPPPDDEDGTFEIHRSPPDSRGSNFYIRTALVGRLPPSSKMNLTVILQGRQQIKRSIPVTIEAGEATRFVFADAHSNRIFGDDATFVYTSGEPLGLRVLAVDESGNKVQAFNGQKAVASLQASGGGGDAASSAKEIQLDMVRGEGDLAHERWFVSDIPLNGSEGRIAIKAARNAGLTGSNLVFPVKPGSWFSDVRFSVGTHAVEALSYEMPADDKLLDLSVKPLMQDGQEFAGDFTITLRPGGSRTHVQSLDKIVPGRGNVKIIQGLEVPTAPGQYLVDLKFQSPDREAPAVYSTLTVTRPTGKLSQVLLKGPSKLCTQSQKQFVLSVSASTSLGAQLAPATWQGDLTFLASEGRLKLSIDIDSRPSPNAATAASYLISLDDEGDIEEDVLVDIWARVGVTESDGLEGSSRVLVESNVIQQFRYIPRARIEKETENVKRKRKEEEELIELLNRYDVLVEAHRQSEAAKNELADQLSKEMGKVCSVFLPGIDQPGDRETVTQALADLLEEKNRTLQQILDEVHWTEPDLQVRRNAALDRYMSRRAQDESYGEVALVGVLGELASVQDDKMASAVAALLDDDLQALVVKTEDDLEKLRKFCIDSDLDSLKIISLQSAAGVQVVEARGSHAERASKHGGTIAYDVIRIRGSDMPALQQLWWRILHGAIIFESEQGMLDYKKEFGRTSPFVVPISGQVEGWRIDGQLFSRCRQHTEVACKLSVPSAAEESRDYKEAGSMVQQLTGARSDIDELAMKLEQAQADHKEKEEKMQAYEIEHGVSALQESLNSLRGEERGSAKKMRASGSGSKDTAIVDLTLSTDDESEGEGAGSSTKPPPVVAQARQIGVDEVLDPDTVIQAVVVPVEGSASDVVAATATQHGGDGDADADGGSDGDGEAGPAKKARH